MASGISGAASHLTLSRFERRALEEELTYTTEEKGEQLNSFLGSLTPQISDKVSQELTSAINRMKNDVVDYLDTQKNTIVDGLVGTQNIAPNSLISRVDFAEKKREVIERVLSVCSQFISEKYQFAFDKIKQEHLFSALVNPEKFQIKMKEQNENSKVKSIAKKIALEYQPELNKVSSELSKSILDEVELKSTEFMQSRINEILSQCVAKQNSSLPFLIQISVAAQPLEIKGSSFHTDVTIQAKSVMELFLGDFNRRFSTPSYSATLGEKTRESILSKISGVKPNIESRIQSIFAKIEKTDLSPYLDKEEPAAKREKRVDPETREVEETDDSVASRWEAHTSAYGKK